MPEPDRPVSQAFEDYPLTRIEYITALTHFYRGERSRADAWRARLDPTTNWAVVTTGGMLSFAFSGADRSHVMLLLANLLVTVFLGFEARRYRYYDLWRSRIRMLEENFFIPIIRRNLISPRRDWRERVAEDLDKPKFKITFLQAVALRIRYNQRRESSTSADVVERAPGCGRPRNNYVWIYSVLLVAWLCKVHLHPTPAATPREAFLRLGIGPFGGWSMLTMTAAFYVVAIAMAIWGGPKRASADEVRGLELQAEQWKS